MEIQNTKYYDLSKKIGEKSNLNNVSKKIIKAARGFEALFIQKLLEQMNNTIKDNGLFGNSPGGDIYKTMFFQEVSKKLSEQKGIGIAKMLIRQWKQSGIIQENTLRDTDQDKSVKISNKPVDKK
jgi:flagellar protein FlgJ